MPEGMGQIPREQGDGPPCVTACTERFDPRRQRLKEAVVERENMTAALKQVRVEDMPLGDPGSHRLFSQSVARNNNKLCIIFKRISKLYNA